MRISIYFQKSTEHCIACCQICCSLNLYCKAHHSFTLNTIVLK